MAGRNPVPTVGGTGKVDPKSAAQPKPGTPQPDPTHAALFKESVDKLPAAAPSPPSYADDPVGAGKAIRTAQSNVQLAKDALARAKAVAAEYPSSLSLINDTYTSARMKTLIDTQDKLDQLHTDIRSGIRNSHPGLTKADPAYAELTKLKPNLIGDWFGRHVMGSEDSIAQDDAAYAYVADVDAVAAENS